MPSFENVGTDVLLSYDEAKKRGERFYNETGVVVDGCFVNSEGRLDGSLEKQCEHDIELVEELLQTQLKTAKILETYLLLLKKAKDSGISAQELVNITGHDLVESAGEYQSNILLQSLLSMRCLELQKRST